MIFTLLTVATCSIYLFKSSSVVSKNIFPIYKAGDSVTSPIASAVWSFALERPRATAPTASLAVFATDLAVEETLLTIDGSCFLANRPSSDSELSSSVAVLFASPSEEEVALFLEEAAIELSASAWEVVAPSASGSDWVTFSPLLAKSLHEIFGANAERFD